MAVDLQMNSDGCDSIRGLMRRDYLAIQERKESLLYLISNTVNCLLSNNNKALNWLLTFSKNIFFKRISDLLKQRTHYPILKAEIVG